FAHAPKRQQTLARNRGAGERAASGEIVEAQIVQAARSWVAKSCAPSSTVETRETATKRFVYVAKNWFRFLGKWRDPERNPQVRPELDSFLKELRDIPERGNQ